ncbi:S-adenosylmethionine decarboxylase family protein [Tellurirhabdus rosea]|uniref:S-adenosylmethionine decarboxylase family protein n=1 Tax=Tellurirhabdus rosea TaxID=2674997 RepID=UPI00225A8398|nr:S-adenosylmethionine decarboxylase [Tellurirhabdus rosea]
MNGYKPGTHLLSSFSASGQKLNDLEGCRAHFDRLIPAQQLQKVGEVYHAFPNGGFTAVIALSESHISIHTWPEFGMATFDIFLSNFKRDNAERTRVIFEETIQFFEAKVKNRASISR